MKVSEKLKNADFWCSWIPVLSTLTNTINLITLTTLKISKKGKSNPYVIYLKNKGYLGCLMCSVPVIGAPAFLGMRIVQSFSKNSSSKPSSQNI